MVAGLRAKVSDLRAERDQIDAKIAPLEAAIENLVAASGGSLLPATAIHLSKQRDSTTTISPRSPKSPTYGSFSGRYTIAPPPPAAPDHGPTPPEASPGWVSMIASCASPYALALAVIRSHKLQNITSPEINNALIRLRKIVGGAGYTVLEPLQKAGVIEGDHTAWRILDRSRGGVVVGEFLWCDPQFLNIYDWAAVRREAIALLLAEHPHVTNAAITKSLESCRWLKSPVTPHLVKADLRIMEKRKQTKMDPENKTWELITSLQLASVPWRVA